MSKKPGLYANIHAKRKRGEKMRKPGEEGAPSAQDFKNAAKTAKKNKGKKREDPGGNLRSYMDTPKMKRGMKREDPKGNPAGYYDSNKKKKADMGRKGPYADGMGKKCTCDSVAEELRGLLINDGERADKPCGNSYIPEAAKCTKGRGTAKASKESLKKRALAKEQEINKGRKKGDPNSPENTGGESVRAKGGYAKFLKKQGIDPSKLGANSKKAESLAMAYYKTPAGRAELAKQKMEFEQSRKRRGLFGRR